MLPLPTDIFTNEDTRALLKEVSDKMSEYIDSRRKSKDEDDAPAPATKAPVEEDEDDLDW